MRRKRPPYRVCTMNVSAARFRDPKNNPQRIRFAQKLLQLAKTKNVDCLCFPAGYLTTGKSTHISSFLAPLIRTARKLDVSFVLGIDLAKWFPNPDSAEFIEVVRKGKIPCLLASFNATTNRLSLTRQRSGTSGHARRKLVSDEIMSVPRVMEFEAATTNVICCGEIYDRRLFSQAMPKAGMVFGHLAMARLSRTLRLCSEMGFSLINSEHRIGRSGLHFCYDRGKNNSVRGGFSIEHDDLWAEIAVWELTDRMRFKPVHDLRD